MPTLNWRTRGQDLKAAANTEYRLLVEDEQYSYGDSDTGNIIVQGDNLEALKALLPFYAGQVKCIYIDPPYNTGSAFEHYDDNVEHTIWLSMMYPRLELLKQFLREDGSIWISIDDTEGHYLKVICDEIFGRNNFLADVIWNSTKSVTNTAIISDACTHTLVYFREKEYWVANRTEFRLPENGSGFTNPDNDPRGAWKADPFQVGGWRPNQQYEIINPITGKIYKPNKGSSWKNEYSKFKELLADNRIVFGKNGKAGPQRKRFLFEAMQRGRVATTLWNEIETTTNATQHSKELFGDNAFTNPKPESFIEKILNLATSPGDYVLDSFLGSGTTAAVAHKMGRRYIGVEMGEQAKTHCAARLKKVIEGEQGGISGAVGWKGGGGFRFFTLGEAVFDREGRIKPDISFEHLAAHIWFTETKTPMTRIRTTEGAERNAEKDKNTRNLPQNSAFSVVESPFLGIHNGTAYALLYNGILGDKNVSGGNVLNHQTLNYIMHEIDRAEEKNGGAFDYNKMVIYGEATRLPHVSLQSNNIEFKQTPYDIKVW